MGARTKSIARPAFRTERRRHHSVGRRASDADALGLQGTIKSLESDIEILRTDNGSVGREKTRLEKEVTRKHELSEHWRKRYFLRDREATKLEGLLSLREARIAELEKEATEKDAQIQELKKLAFQLPKSEKEPLKGAGSKTKPQRQKRRKRGRQQGAPGHGRNNHDHLPIEDERILDIPESEKVCPACGDALKEVGSEDSDEVEIEIRGYRRKYRRKKYGHTCKSRGRWVTRTAPPAPKIWPKAAYGISIWVFLLIGKFILQIPVHRLCILLRMEMIRISEGTIVAGFSRIDRLIDPLIEEIKRYSREEKHHWHIDDTGWKVFVVIDEKAGFGWYLWVFLSDDVCVYILSPSRGRKVPQSHLENSVGVATSDRLASNMKLGEHVINSYCWVHIRRDLRKLAVAYPEIADVCQAFLDLIGSLFHYNKQRLLSEDGSVEFAKAQDKLAETLEQIEKDCRSQMSDPNLHPELVRVFTGMLKDWDGLRLFLDLPSIPADNNPAERALRGPVVGRKNYYGSYSQSSGHFTAKMFTLSETLRLNNIDPQKFLNEYFTACAKNGGKPPPNAKDFLPWNRKTEPTSGLPP